MTYPTTCPECDASLDHTPHEHVAIVEWQSGVAVLVEALQRMGSSKPVDKP